MYSIIAAILALPFTTSIAFADEQSKTTQESESTVTFGSPFGEDATIETVLVKLIGVVKMIAYPVAAIMILYGAFQILTSAGNEQKYKAGRKTILYALGGFIIILLAQGLVAILEALTKELGI